LCETEDPINKEKMSNSSQQTYRTYHRKNQQEKEFTEILKPGTFKDDTEANKT